MFLLAVFSYICYDYFKIQASLVPNKDIQEIKYRQLQLGFSPGLKTSLCHRHSPKKAGEKKKKEDISTLCCFAVSVFKMF